MAPIRLESIRAGVLIAVTVLAGCGRVPERPHEARAQPSIEIIHWLGSSDEAAALAIVRDAVIEQGGAWRDTPMPGVAIAQATAVNRIVGGTPPGAFQISVGPQLVKFKTRGLIGPAPVDRAALDDVLPPLIAQAAKQDGVYLAVPAYIRGENWMFYNTEVLRRHGLAVPETWPELLATAKVLKANGTTPIALGGQPWQERILFNSVLVGVGGADLYRRVYVDRDVSAARSAAMLEVFTTFGALRAYVDEGSPGRPWNQATEMLLRGDAGFQFMGDWAKSAIRAAGHTPGGDIGCALAPAPAPAYIVAVDAFAFPSTNDPSILAGQRMFANVLLDPSVQKRMSLRLGSIPVGRGVHPDGFDLCAQRAMATIREPGAILPSTGLFALPAGVSGAIDDGLSLFWHDPRLTPAAGQTMFVKTLATYAPQPSVKRDGP